MTGTQSTSNSLARLRREVAITSRILVMEGMLDYSGHVSVRIPDQDAYYIQPSTDPRSHIDPERLIMVDFEGNILGDHDRKPPVEIPIHGEIYKARPDVQSLVHCHMELAIMFTMMEDVQLVPMRSRAARWASGIPTSNDPTHIKTKKQGKILADDLGPHHAALMRAHGLILVAESVPALLVDAVHFDENARAQMQVMQAGRKIKPLTPEELDLLEKSEMREFHVGKLWKYYLNKAEKIGIIPPEWAEETA